MDSSFHGEVFDLQDLLSLAIIFRFRQLAITTAALALPLALLRRQRSTHSRRTSPSHLTSPPETSMAASNCTNRDPTNINDRDGVSNNRSLVSIPLGDPVARLERR